MSNIILWDEYETSLLIDKYLKIETNEISFFEAVSSLSKELRMRAENKGIKIDDKFRNENGINMQMNIIRGLMNNDKRGLTNSSKMLKKMVWLYKFRKPKFDEILMEAKMSIDNSKLFINETSIITTNDTYETSTFDIDTLNKISVECLEKFKDYCDKSKIYKIYEINDTDFVAFKKLYCVNFENVAYLKEFILNLNKDTNINVFEKSLIDKNVGNNYDNCTTTEIKKKNEKVNDNLIHGLYENIDLDSAIDVLNLTVRAYNCLTNNGINKISDLIECSDDKIIGFKNIGVKTFEEIKNKINIIRKQEINELYINSHDLGVQITLNLKAAIINSLFSNDPLDLDMLTDDELRIYNKLKLAIEEIGYDMCYCAFFKPQSTALLLNVFDPFVMVNKLNKLYSHINYNVKIRKIKPYIEAYPINKIEKEYLIEKLCNGDCEYLYQLKGNFLNIAKEQELFKKVYDFLNFLNKDINDYIDSFFTEIFKVKRNYVVLSRRANGQTLEEIGIVLGVTRERVRQIESKLIKKFNAFNGRRKVLLYIYAILNGNSVINDSEIREVIKRYAEELIYLLKTVPSNHYHYNKELDIFVIGKIDYIVVKKRIDALPIYILNSEIDDIVNEISNEIVVPKKILYDSILKKYKHSGKVYHKTNTSLTFAYEVTLKTYYSHGIKLFDDSELLRFRLYVNDLFGDIKLPQNNRAIEARITEIGILCDRGMYIHKDYVRINNEQIEAIDTFIQSSERSVISFLELYEMFKNELNKESSVDNRYYLQGVLKYYLGNKYYFSRDNISKEKNINLDYEIMQFIKDIGEVSKAEIKSNFNGITEAMLLQIIARNKDIIIINEGMYMSSDNLCIIEKDYKILDLIKPKISEFPISSRKLFEIMSYDYTDFFMRNNISSHTKLFGILQYMFSDKLRFSRPFIGDFSNNEFTIINIVKKYLSNFVSIKISELIEFCKENQLNIISPTTLLQQLDDYMRIDADEIIRVDEVELEDEKIQQICDTIENDVKIKGYLSAKIIDFLYYPDINIKWNGFLLSSIVKKFSDAITITEFYSSDVYTLSSVFIDSELEIDNYEDFLRWIIKSEHSRSPFTDINELKAWLTCEGLINIKLPKFITDTQYVYQDEYGKLIVQ